MNTIDLESNFFGRKSILELLKRRVIDLKEGYRQNVAFLGSRFIGKTSLLQKFITDFDDDDVIDIYVDLDGKDFQYFFLKFAGSILNNFSRSKMLAQYDELNLLMESTRRFIPQTVEEIKKIKTAITKGRTLEAYRDLIALPEIFTVESGKFCIIMLDEFHNLDNFAIPNAFQELGKKIMTQKRCLYVVTSSLPNVAKKILSEKLSLLFGNFEIISVASFDLKTSQGIIEHNLGIIKMSPDLRNFLIDFTGGHPFYLNIICQELITLCAIHRQEEVFLPFLIQAIENTIFNKWGILSRHFEFILNNLSAGKGQHVMPSILISLANGKHKVKDIMADVGLKKSFLMQKINRLVELGIIVKNGDFYNFQDKLLKYWVKYVFQKRMKAIDSVSEKQRNQFVDEISYLVHSFQVVSQKDLPARIVELLHCFDNESFHLNGRKYKLPLFREIISMKLKSDAQGSFDAIKAFSPEGTWFIILKEDTLLEGDVNTFLTESKKLGQKPQRRVIISLKDLDANARLRALQEKVWIWNEGEINALLSLYDKPYIVR